MVPTGTFCPVFGGKEIRGTDMIGEIEQFTEYLQNVKQMSRNTVLSYRRDLLQMAAYLNERGITDAGRVTKTSLNSYILFLGRLVPEKGVQYLIKAFKSVNTEKKLVIAGGSSDTDSFIKELKEYLKNYADNFEKFDENKSKKFVFQIVNNNLKKKKIELNCTNSK